MYFRTEASSDESAWLHLVHAPLERLAASGRPDPVLLVVDALDEDGFLHVIGRAVDIQEVGGRLVAPTDIEEALCRLPAVRYAVAVVDPVSRLVTAAVVAWPGLKVEDRSCRHAIEEHFGAGFASSVLIVPVERVPLTEQGKPDRTAIGQLAQRPAAA